MKLRSSIPTLVVILCLGVAAAHADWGFYSLSSLYVAGSDVDPHPEEVRFVVAGPLRENPLAGVICGFYCNNFEQRNKGRFVMRGEVVRADGSTESFRGRSGIKRNSGERCVVLTTLVPEDVITVTYEFENFPDLTREGPNDEDPDRFTVSTFVVSQGGGPNASAADLIAAHRARVARGLQEGEQ